MNTIVDHIPKIEKTSKKQIEDFQNIELQKLMSYLAKHSTYYQGVFAQEGIDFETIKTAMDLQSIPVTTKDDLQKHNKNFQCVDDREIIDYVTTSGTMGEPVTFAMTDADLERLAYNEYISFGCTRTSPDDVYQLMLTLDKRFLAGIAYYMGLRKHGAGIVRVGPGSPELQFDSIKRFSPTALVTVPSFIPRLLDFAEEKGIDLAQTSIKKAICIGEPIRNIDFSLNTLGKRIKDKWNIDLYSTYASTEMGTAFTECEMGQGGHHHPELIIVEFLDENNQPVKSGEAGEVCITTLGVEAMPLLRFKTGDICHYYDEPCACGRNTIRLGPVIGRRQQMIKFKGTSLYPPAFYEVLNDIEEVKNYYVELRTNKLGTDEVSVVVGSLRRDDKFIKRLKDAFRVKLRVAPEIIFDDPKKVQQKLFENDSRKPIIFRDLR